MLRACVRVFLIFFSFLYTTTVPRGSGRDQVLFVLDAVPCFRKLTVDTEQPKDGKREIM